MTYRLVQHFGLARSEHGDAPCPAVVEDEEGDRLLLVESLIPVEVWSQAAQLGVVGLARISEAGLAYTPVEQFSDYRTKAAFGANFQLADQHWAEPVPPGRSVREMARRWRARRERANPFVHLHTHSEFSPLDGLSTMDEIGTAVLADGQSAIGIADHGTCAGHPALQRMATEFGIRPVFGIEAYFTGDRHARVDPHDYWHLCLFAKDDQGLRNLWGLSTESYRDGFYGKPRIDWDSLARWREGLICSTACLRGPLLGPFGHNDETRAVANLGRLGELFGEDLYLELHTNHLPAQVAGNNWLVQLAARYRVPMIAAVDSHYAGKEQRQDHRVWLGVTTASDVVDDSDLFAGEQDYHLMSVAEVRDSLSYLDSQLVESAVRATGELAAKCTAQIRPQQAKPVFSRPTAEHSDPVRHDEARFVDGALANWDERITRRGMDPKPYLERSRYEGRLLLDKQYAGYYLICADFVNWAKEHGILVGPGRGSGSASLYAYLHRITEVDPIEANLSLDRFMTPGRKSLPDFDIDLPSTRAEEVIDYVQHRWGHEHVARVGSHIRLQNKGAFKGVQIALASQLPEGSYGWVETINKLVGAAEATTAGLGLGWDELMDQVGESLDPFKERAPALFYYAEMFQGRLRTYGKHAAGFIIDPDTDLEAELPMRSSGDGGPMVTQFDMDALEYLGKVKFDFLRLKTLDIVQGTIDRIKADTGRSVNPYAWHEEFTDPQIFEGLADGWTMGIFQIETPLGTRTTRTIRPQTRAQVADVIAIGRPGPLRSGLDRVYYRRRSGEESVDYPDPRLEAILGPRFGVMLYQEDIMAICTVLAGYDADEADHVRGILGKKKIELVEAEGTKFVDRAVENGTDKGVALAIWAQMAEFAKYAFNLAHAYSYATVSLWEAWLKTHYVRQFMAEAMTSIDKDRIPAFVAEARRLGYAVLPPDINDSKAVFAAKDLVIRYGFTSVAGIGEASTQAILAGQPYTSYADFLARKGAANMGVVRKLVTIGAFDSLHPNRRALEAQLVDDVTGFSEKCVNLHPEMELNEHNLPCVFDWSSEPVRLGRTGKPLKTQLLPPKRCTKACRHYSPRGPRDYAHLPNYTAEEVRNREIEALGVYLSSSPFDQVPADVMTKMYTAEDLVLAERGVYPLIVMITSSRPDAKGRDFGFASFATPAGDLSTIVFARLWAKVRPKLRKGALAFITVAKSGDDRYQLESLDLTRPFTEEELRDRQAQKILSTSGAG